MAGFTAVLAIVAILQVVLVRSQLNYQKKDERPWIHAKLKGPQLALTENQPLVVPVEFSNLGKTPAREISVLLFVGIVDADKSPTLPDPEKDATTEQQYTAAVTGISFHEDPPFEIKAVRRAKNPKTGQWEDWLLTTDELKALQDGKSYLVTYSIVHYVDTLGTKHWTTFCDWNSFHVGDYSARGCTAYNNVDDNS
jgi:hypothetical protein